MKRAPIVISATVFGTAAVLGFHAHQPTSSLASGATITTNTTATTTKTSASTTTTKMSASSSGSATGAAENTRYGPAQVKVTVKNGKIVAVTALQLQSRDPKSQQISSYAAPILQQEVLSKQTAAVNTVSGATYTSGSYLASVQTALDKLGYKASDGSTASTDVSTLQ